MVAVLGAIVGMGSAAPASAADSPSSSSSSSVASAPLVIAHRGASAVAPEHTFAAYDRAIEQHADVIECDLQLTKDEVLVCLHDTTVDRTTGGTATGRVDSFTLEELRAMDFGAWFGPEFSGASIVPFEEQLRCYRKEAPGVQFYAETKAPSEYGGHMEPRLVELLRRLDLIPKGAANPRSSPVIVQSFERDSLQAVKRLAPSLPTAWLWIVPPADVPADGSMPSGIDVMAPTASNVVNRPEMVGQVHAAGGEVHTWTVDDPAEMDQLLDDGVDGIFTNDSATLRAHIDARTGHATRKPVNIKPGCPGIAGTVTAAGATTGDAPAGSTTSRVQAANPKGPEGDSSSWVPLAIAIAIAVVAGAAVVWWSRRRRT